MITVRRHAFLLLALAFIAPIYFAWTGHNQIGQFGGDGPSYLMMAQHYSFSHSRDPIYSDTASSSRFPPFYPFLLSLFGASTDLVQAHIVTTSFLLLALTALYTWLLGEGFSPSQSTLLTLLFAMLPGTWLLGLSVQSEYVYLFFSMLALSFLAAHERSKRDEALYAAAITIAAAVLTRTIGVALFLPLLVAALRAQRRSAFFAICVALLPFLAWQLLHRSPNSDGYLPALRVYKNGNYLFEAIRRQLSGELPALLKGIGGNFVYGVPVPSPVSYALALFCGTGLIWRLKKRKPDGMYAAANLAILLAWPFPEEAQRFLWVLLPLLFVQPLLLLADVCGGSLSARIPQAGIAIFGVIILSISLPAISAVTDRYRDAAYSNVPSANGFLSWYRLDPADAESNVEFQAVLINALQSIPRDVPITDCVIATRPDLVNYYSHRVSLRPPLKSAPDDYFNGALRASTCRYVFVYAGADVIFPATMYPLERIGTQSRLLWQAVLPGTNPGESRIVAALLQLTDAEKQ